jgi:hypothetical protein
MAVPFAFANLSGNIALSKLDSNFNTPITIGNTSVQLGGTITTLNNMTLSNVTISGGTNNVTETLANVTTLNATSAFITTGNITTANVGNLTLLNALTVPNGGTGMVSLPANNVLLGNGTSPVASIAPGTVGNVLTSTGTGWVSSTVSGSGNAAPNTASYVLISSNANLTSGRVLTAGANVTITDNGPGSTIVINSSGGGGGGGSGTVTSVSVVSANGLAGTVANATTTPAITLSTSVTGLLKGNGTAIGAATANTDYQSPVTLTTTGTSGAATFISNTLNIPQYSSGGAPTPDVQTFDSTGTWTKPTGYTMARVQVWGGGGGGGRTSSANIGSGGGGGGYNEITVPISYLAATVTATVASGGLGATTNTSGAVGGQSSFALATAYLGRSSVDAYGGGGGGATGGGGGGQLSAGTTGSIIGGDPLNNNAWHGGSGGCFNLGACPATPATGALFGGGGGTYTGGTAAVSLYGGVGGVNAAGTQPGGGGGASRSGNTNGSNGAAGRIVVTCW